MYVVVNGKNRKKKQKIYDVCKYAKKDYVKIE